MVFQFGLEVEGRVNGVSAVGQQIQRSIKGSGNENVTTMACISVSGELLPSWKDTNYLKYTCYAGSEKAAIFISWFVKFCAMVPQRTLLIKMDMHVSYLDRGTIEQAIQNGVTLFKLPPYAANVLQPLDKCCFGPLKLN